MHNTQLSYVQSCNATAFNGSHYFDQGPKWWLQTSIVMLQHYFVSLWTETSRSDVKHFRWNLHGRKTQRNNKWFDKLCVDYKIIKCFAFSGSKDSQEYEKDKNPIKKAKQQGKFCLCQFWAVMYWIGYGSMSFDGQRSHPIRQHMLYCLMAILALMNLASAMFFHAWSYQCDSW